MTELRSLQTEILLNELNRREYTQLVPDFYKKFVIRALDEAISFHELKCMGDRNPRSYMDFNLIYEIRDYLKTGEQKHLDKIGRHMLQTEDPEFKRLCEKWKTGAS